MSRESTILSVILVAIIGGLIGLFALSNSGGPNSSSQNQTADAKTLLKSTTPHEGTGAVKVVEFGDYQCPACGAYQKFIPKILSDYSGKITLYFRNFPLPNLHPNAIGASNGVEEAGALGKFWQMHDLMYEKQTEWASLPADQAQAKWAEYATSLGIDGNKVRDAASNQTHKSLIDQDIKDGNALNVNSTPTFFVNGVQVTAPGEQGLRDAIDGALKSKK